MIREPHTYSEWAKVLEIFKEKSDDSEILTAMKSGTIEWQSGVAERFSKKLIDAVNTRINMAVEKFQLDMSRTNGQESAIVQAMLALRKELLFVYDAVNLPAIPDKFRESYLTLIQNEAQRVQKSLEDSAKSDRSGKMSSIVRNHKISVG